MLCCACVVCSSAQNALQAKKRIAHKKLHTHTKRILSVLQAFAAQLASAAHASCTTRCSAFVARLCACYNMHAHSTNGHAVQALFLHSCCAYLLLALAVFVYAKNAHAHAQASTHARKHSHTHDLFDINNRGVSLSLTLCI